MATEQDLREIERAFCQPASWKTFGPFASVLTALPKIDGRSPLRVCSGDDEARMAKLGYTTAWTDTVTITFTSKFLESLTRLGVTYVLAHENGHIALKHGARRRGRQPLQWNFATDNRINDMLNLHIMPLLIKGNKQFEPSMLMVKKTMRGIGFTPDTRHWLEYFRENTEEEIYYLLDDELKKRRNDVQNGTGKSKGKSKPGSGKGGGGGDGSGSLEDYDFDLESMDDHIDSALDLRRQLEDEFGEDGKSQADRMDLPKDEAEQKHYEQVAESAVTTARQRSKTSNRGIGGPIDRFVDDAIEIDIRAKSKYNFKLWGSNELFDAQQGSYVEDRDVPDDISLWSRIPELRDLMGMGEVFRPEIIKKKRQARALGVLDTSGSMGEDDLKYASIELYAMFSDNDLELTIVSADTESRFRMVLGPDSIFPIPMRISGGGGTDMLTPVVQEICSADKPYDMIFVLTDGGFRSYSYDELKAHITKIDPSKVSEIPPIAYVITTPYFEDPSLNKNALTFPAGRCKVFCLTDPETKHVSSDIEISSETISMG
jgi:hypothetical protein